MSLVFGKSENESKEEKEAHKMHSKADPTKAINEAQPGIISHFPGMTRMVALTGA